MAEHAFPAGFLWGAATSSYQIEGAVGVDGRGESIWDRFAATPGKIADGSDGRRACDHFHRWHEDVALMRQLGLRAYRFSIAWPRVMPSGRGRINIAGLDFYDRLVDALLEAGIKPFATLYHWDLPQRLQDEGGWAARSTALAFVEYADAVSRRLGDRVFAWATHNEPWCIANLGYRWGEQAPGLRDPAAALATSHHVLLSHGLAVPILRGNSRTAQVGIVLNLVPAEPASPSDADREATRRFDGEFNRWYLDPLFGRGYPADVVADWAREGLWPAGGPEFVRPGDFDAIAEPIDFLGVNNYSREVIRSDAIPEEQNAPRTVERAPRSEWTDMNWEVYPDGLRTILERVHREYGPAAVFVTENGAAFPDRVEPDGRIHDVRRVRYLHGHIAATRAALEAGVPLRGYFAWSLLDNFEWAHGYRMRFGIVHVDFETCQRRPKDSFFYYRDVIAHNAVVPTAASEEVA